MKGLKDFNIGDNCFCRCRLHVFEDLASLTSFVLGIGVFEGDEQNQNTLTMKSTLTLSHPT